MPIFFLSISSYSPFHTYTHAHSLTHSLIHSLTDIHTYSLFFLFSANAYIYIYTTPWSNFLVWQAYIVQLYAPLNFFGTYFYMIQQNFVDMGTQTGKKQSPYAWKFRVKSVKFIIDPVVVAWEETHICKIRSLISSSLINCCHSENMLDLMHVLPEVVDVPDARPLIMGWEKNKQRGYNLWCMYTYKFYTKKRRGQPCLCFEIYIKASYLCVTHTFVSYLTLYYSVWWCCLIIS